MKIMRILIIMALGLRTMAVEADATKEDALSTMQSQIKAIDSIKVRYCIISAPPEIKPAGVEQVLVPGHYGFCETIRARGYSFIGVSCYPGVLDGRKGRTNPLPQEHPSTERFSRSETHHYAFLETSRNEDVHSLLSVFTSG